MNGQKCYKIKLNFGLKHSDFLKIGGNDRHISRCWFNKDIAILACDKLNRYQLYDIGVELQFREWVRRQSCPPVC